MVNTGVLLDRAGLLLEQGRIQDAENAARDVLSKEPYNDVALAILGRCAYEGGHFRDGMGFISEALAIRPEHSFYYYLLGFGHYQLEAFDDATEHLEAAQALHPHVAEYYGLHAFILLAQKSWQAALEKADEGLALEADNLTCLNARSRALNKLRRNSEAIDTMQDALAVDPHNEHTHVTVAWNYLEKGTHKSAQHHFREALRLSPNNEAARTGLKEALKSNIAPYRWLLQYHFWLHNRGKRWRAAAPIVLYVLFRLLSSALGSSEATKDLVWIPVTLYLLLVITSWTISPIANFVLLFHPLGRHAVTVSERWSAITVVGAVFSGLALLTAALFTPWFTGTPFSETVFFAAVTLITLALPLGQITYPLAWRRRSRGVRIAMALTALGLLTVAFAPLPQVQMVFFALYGICFMLYNWIGLFR